MVATPLTRCYYPGSDRPIFQPLRSEALPMNDQPHAAAESLSRSLLQRIDEVCDRFENAWQVGPRPAIEEYLGSTAEPSHYLLLRELLGLELHYRGQNGEVLDAEDYVA